MRGPFAVTSMVLLLACLLTLAVSAAPANAAPCGGDFASWLQGVQQEAAGKGISQATIQSALGGVSFDPGIIARDHAQGVFRQSFEQFAGRMVPPRLGRGRRMMQQYASVLSRYRAAIRRARVCPRRHLGIGNGFRRRQRPFPDHPLAGELGLRLPAAGQIPRRADRRAADRRARRHEPGRHARRLGRRNRPDPVPAVVVSQIRSRPRSHSQSEPTRLPRPPII